ncbi:hypothetical protein D3C71_1715140 [compost metagenome]
MAEYNAMYGMGKKPSTEPMLMMRPLPWLRILGTTARTMRTMPKKLVSKIIWAWASELSSAAAGATPNPALLISRSMWPSRCTSVRTAASTDASLVTSSASIPNGSPSALPPRRLVP